MKHIISLIFILFLTLINAHAAPLVFHPISPSQEHRPVIYVSKAQCLNADKKLIADITKLVKTKDNVWAVIHNGEYVRVTFDQVLDNNYDNSIYARPSDSKEPAALEVYPVYTDKKGIQIEFPEIAVFPTVDHEGFYKIMLTRLQIPTKTFDYKIMGNVDIDYIVDPAFTLLKSIGILNYGSNPVASLVLSGSTLYGIAGSGGTSEEGLIFSIATNGSGFTVLHDFSGSTTDGESPDGSLTLSGSTLYGMTYGGGAYSDGIIFSISTSGGTLTDLHDFSESSTDGANPMGDLTLSGSALYGMTQYGGASGDGIIFSIATGGGMLTDLHDFSNSSTDGGFSQGSLTLSGSTLYGMTEFGGANGLGIIFSIATSGGALTDMHDFSGSTTDGANPQGDLILSGSKLYGMAGGGGADNEGIIFSIATSGGALTDTHDFSGSVTDGASPAGSLTLSGSTLYGTANGGGVYGDGVIFSIAATGGTLTDLHDFSGSVTDGENPGFSLIFSGSNLYGVTSNGGAYNNNGGGAGDGIIFSIAASGGALTDLHDFSGNIDGEDPDGALTISGSTMYGMTARGGGYDFPTVPRSITDGIIFSVGTDGSSFTILHDFSGTSTDGASPFGSLTLSGSTLYGMTWVGGAYEDGIIFSMATSGGVLTDLHDFSNSSTDGGFSQGSLTLSGSTLYGMSNNGGAYGDGIIFSIATTGSTFKDLHDFSGSSNDGQFPFGDLTISGSTLYGMASSGGVDTDGIIFSIATTGGTLTDLHDFSGSPTDGANPTGDLTLLGSTLYGTAGGGGADDEGIVFSIAASGGALTDLHDFSGSSTDGAGPFGSLTLVGTTLYGTTGEGGVYGDGIIFAIATSGGAFKDLHDFSGGIDDGAGPNGFLTL